MKVDHIKVGLLRANCYLLEKNNQYLLVDPGEDLKRILQFIHGKNIVGILVTHHHRDHVASLDYLRHKFSYPVYEFPHLKEGVVNTGNFTFEVIFTPGHQNDCVSYYFREDKVLFTGDFLFKGTVGRCDLDGSDEMVMKNSIEKIKKYDDDIVVYPGHGIYTSLGEEKKYNPFFR